jgi:hypothetical protein
LSYGGQAWFLVEFPAFGLKVERSDKSSLLRVGFIFFEMTPEESHIGRIKLVR